MPDSQQVWQVLLYYIEEPTDCLSTQQERDSSQEGNSSNALVSAPSNRDQHAREALVLPLVLAGNQ
jgi:hypothetical protein